MQKALAKNRQERYTLVDDFALDVGAECSSHKY